MSRISNTIKIAGNIATILITKNDDIFYLKEVLVDVEDMDKIGKIHIKQGYPWTKQQNLAHLIMNHLSNMTTIVDHINGNPLDNRKKNLRILSQHANSTNKRKTKSNVGIPGISRRRTGNYEYFRATCSDLRSTVISTNQYSKHGRMTKRISKQFNINKLGETTALKQAKNWLNQKQQEFGYPPRS